MCGGVCDVNVCNMRMSVCVHECVVSICLCVISVCACARVCVSVPEYVLECVYMFVCLCVVCVS